MNLAEFIKDWRKRSELSQTKAATLLGMPARTLQGIEQGRPFKYERLLILAINNIQTLEGAE